MRGGRVRGGEGEGGGALPPAKGIRDERALDRAAAPARELTTI